MSSAVHTAVSVTAVTLIAKNESDDEVRATVSPIAKIFIGGTGVTKALGIPLVAGAVFQYVLAPKESLYAIADTGTVDVRVLVAPGADLTGV